MPRIGTTGTNGQRNGRSASGSIRRMISTAAQTITKANSVPMLVRCKQGVDRQEAGQAGHEDADQDGALPRRLERGMNVGEDAPGHQAVAGHRQEDARALSIMTSKHGGDAGHAGDGDDELGPAQADLR